MLKFLWECLFGKREYIATSNSRVHVQLESGEVYLWITDIDQGIIIGVEDAEALVGRMRFIIDSYMQDNEASVVSIRSPE